MFFIGNVCCSTFELFQHITVTLPQVDKVEEYRSILLISLSIQELRYSNNWLQCCSKGEKS